MTYHLTEGKLDAPAHADVVEGLADRLGASLPSDYLDFLRQHNGGEGFIGDNYIIFWRAEELVDFNREYEVDKYAPGILLFGADGGGEGYGFDTQTGGMPIIRIPLIGMERRYATLVAKNFPDLFAKRWS
jgi:SMI1/KNR4 family protein SUKH-1